MKALPRVDLAKFEAWTPQWGAPRDLAAEGLGTFVLVLAAVGVGSGHGIFGAPQGMVALALAPGLTLAALLLVLGPVAKRHFNPAISLGMALAGRLPKARLLPYIAAQTAGALGAGLVLRGLLRGNLLGLSETNMNPGAAVVLEAVLSFWLQWVYLALSEDGSPALNGALGAGFTVSAAALWAGPLCGASMNPARSLGPALVAGEFSDLWIYLVGPFLGCAAGVWVYRRFRALRD